MGPVLVAETGLAVQVGELRAAGQAGVMKRVRWQVPAELPGRHFEGQVGGQYCLGVADFPLFGLAVDLVQNPFSYHLTPYIPAETAT